MNKYYVYVYLNTLRPGNFNYENFLFDYEPFYVGKGKDDRMYHHLNKVKNTCKYKSNSKFSIIEECIKNNTDPIIIKLFDNLTEDDSLIKENEIIKKIGRLDLNTGPLTNKNDGGLKPQDNYHHDDNAKMKISIGGKKRDPEKRYDLVSPDGILYTDVKLNIFCIDHNLDYQKIRKSSNKGKIKPIRVTSIKQSKPETINCVGWEVINKKVKKEIKINRHLKYKLISPNKVEYLIYSDEFIKDKCNELELDARTLRYYKNTGVISIKNTTQGNIKSINCQGWQFIDLETLHLVPEKTK